MRTVEERLLRHVFSRRRRLDPTAKATFWELLDKSLSGASRAARLAHQGLSLLLERDELKLSRFGIHESGEV